jgi:hypothetical protein
MGTTNTVNSNLDSTERVLKNNQFTQKRSDMGSHRDVQASVDSLNNETLNGPKLLTQRTVSMPVLKTREGQNRGRSTRKITVANMGRKGDKTTKTDIESNEIACILNLQPETGSRSLSDKAGMDDTRVSVGKTLEHTIGQAGKNRIINGRTRMEPETEDTKDVIHPASEEPGQVMDRIGPN